MFYRDACWFLFSNLLFHFPGLYLFMPTRRLGQL